MLISSTPSGNCEPSAGELQPTGNRWLYSFKTAGSFANRAKPRHPRLHAGVCHCGLEVERTPPTQVRGPDRTRNVDASVPTEEVLNRRYHQLRGRRVYRFQDGVEPSFVEHTVAATCGFAIHRFHQLRAFAFA